LYAFAFGADAVYAGAPLFSLRARENDFNKESLREAVDHTHRLGKKIYLTLNIFAHNSRLQRSLDAFCEMSEWEPDGFILSDLGLITKARKLRPNTPIHLSTQANTTNWAAVEFWRDLGLKRIVLARELTLKEIAEIHHKVPDIELEAFVHGSMCMAYSGRCLISNYLNHRNANEGTCNNACRWEYSLAAKNGSIVQSEQQRTNTNDIYQPLEGDFELHEPMRMSAGGSSLGAFPIDEDEHGTYLMNSKDLCAIELLKELKEAGVLHFKVEGRSKTIHYVATVARAYRQAIDEMQLGLPFRPELLNEVVAPSNRTLMTGFLLKRPNQYGENFEDGLSQPLTHSYLGHIDEIVLKDGLVWLDLKNRIKCGDTIEWVMPDKTISSKLDYIVKKDGTPVDSLSGGLNCGLRPPTGLKEFTILRKLLEMN
jgi:putative protease